MSIGKYSFTRSEIVNGIIVDGEFKDPWKFSKFGNIPNIVGKDAPHDSRIPPSRSDLYIILFTYTSNFIGSVFQVYVE